MGPENILIIEDDRDIRETLAEVLDGEGFPTRTAADGTEGLAQLARPPLPGLILLDLMMPKMNGWEFLRERARKPTWAKIPVVVMSAVPGAEAIPAVTKIFKKPLDFAGLMATVREVCLRRPRAPRHVRRSLVAYAVEAGWLTERGAEHIIAQSAATNRDVGRALADAGLDEEQLAFLGACRLGLSFVSLDHVLVTPEALAAFPDAQRRANGCFPLHLTADDRPLTLYMAMAPDDAQAVAERLSHALGLTVIPVVASAGGIARAIRRHAGHGRPLASKGIPAEWLDLDSPATTTPRGEARPIDSRFLHPGWQASFRAL